LLGRSPIQRQSAYNSTYKDLKVMLKSPIAIVLSLLIAIPACAEETWTNLNIYVFATDIEGEAQIRNVTSDVDVGFDDILDRFANRCRHRKSHAMVAQTPGYISTALHHAMLYCDQNTEPGECDQISSCAGKNLYLTGYYLINV
jgi:hypothetical protein